MTKTAMSREEAVAMLAKEVEELEAGIQFAEMVRKVVDLRQKLRDERSRACDGVRQEHPEDAALVKALGFGRELGEKR